MNDEVGISNKLVPLERSGGSLRNRGRQNPSSGKKKGNDTGGAPSEIQQAEETAPPGSPEEPSSGKIVDIVI
jgi:hypothetical protein